MKIGVIGIGLIGGSIARDLGEKGHEVYGYDRLPVHEDIARDTGLIKQSLPLEELCTSCEAIFVCIPVDLAAELVDEILHLIGWNTVVIDTGSTKSSICRQLRNHKKRGRFVASHPLAGTEFSGPKAALTGLFAGKKNIICEEHLSDEDALSVAIELMDSMQMQTLFMNAEEHDKHMAYVSHLSHVSAFMLSSTVLDIEKDQKQIVNLASTGFQSTVRLAKSSSRTWAPIFNDNAQNILKALDSYIDHLSGLREAINNGDTEMVMNIIEGSNDIKRVLSGMKHNIVKLS